MRSTLPSAAKRKLVSAAAVAGVLLAVAAPALTEPKQVSDLSAFVKQYLGEAAGKDKFQFAVISDTHVGSDRVLSAT